MSDTGAGPAQPLSWLHVAGAALLLGAIWSVSSLGYYRLQPLLGLAGGYNEAPLFYLAYYAGWTGFVGLYFRNCYRAWALGGQPAQSNGFIVAEALLFTTFALVVLPALPEAEVQAGRPASELVLADWPYFIPKSAEILFQQVIVIALILHLQRLGLGLRGIGLLTATLFGGFHLSLALADADPFYVARYTVAATAFGAVMPWLVLRVPSGLVLSYGLHWSFYALDKVAGHLLA